MLLLIPLLEKIKEDLLDFDEKLKEILILMVMETC